TPEEPSEKPTRNLKPPTGLTETTSITGGTRDAEAAAVRLRMMLVLHQLRLPELDPGLYQIRLLTGKHAPDDRAIADAHQGFVPAINRMNVRWIMIFKEHLDDDPAEDRNRRHDG